MEDELELCYADCDLDYAPGPSRDMCYENCKEELGE